MITVVDMQEDETVSIGTGSHAEWSWYIYNRHSEPIFVSMAIDCEGGSHRPSSHDLSIGGSTEGIKIAPEEGEMLRLRMEVSRSSSPGLIEAELKVVITDLDDGSSEELLIPLQLQISSSFQGEGSYGRILGVFPNSLPAPLDGPAGAVLASMAFYILLAVTLHSLVLSRLLKRDLAVRTSAYNQALRLLRAPVLFAVLLFGTVQCFYIAGASEATLLAVESVADILYVIIGSGIAWAVYKALVRHLLSHLTFRRGGKTDLSSLPLLNWIGMLIISLGALSAVLAILGFDIMVILTGAGILGLAMSLGAQDLLKKFFAGLSLLMEQPFKEGDLLQMDGGVVVEVIRVGLRSTTFYNIFDPQYFIIPNDVVANEKIVNVMRPDARYKAKVEVGVARGSDVALVKKAMLEAANLHPEVLKTPDEKPSVRFLGFGDSTMNFRLFTWVDDFRQHFRIIGELKELLYASFQKYGIEIPLPQQDVRIREAGPAMGEKTISNDDEEDKK